jgi:hypothetical protein
MFIFRGSNATKDGEYRNVHLATILEYLRGQNEEDKATTLQKLALILGLAQRQIRENYLDGLIAFGVISLSSDCKRWHWVGSIAIKNKYGKLRTNTPEDNNYVVKNLSENPATDYMNQQKEKK